MKYRGYIIKGKEEEVAPRTGGRGLKCGHRGAVCLGKRRPPHRGAWIEILCAYQGSFCRPCRPPHRGAWIEIRGTPHDCGA